MLDRSITLQGAPGCVPPAQSTALGIEHNTAADQSSWLKEINGQSTGFSDFANNESSKSVRNIALTLVLTEIARQARATTAATGSVVLLMEGGTPVCGASSGVIAEEASEYLNGCSGCHSSARTICEDSEMDSRFESALLRRLGVRSFVILPVVGENNSVVAILEVFSSCPGAFSERDSLALHALGRRIADYIELADRTCSSDDSTALTTDQNMVPAQANLNRSARWLNRFYVAVPSEGWNLLLGAMTILLAILVGWMIGRAERQTAARSTTPSAQAVVSQSHTTVDLENSTHSAALRESIPDTKTAVPSTDTLAPHMSVRTPQENKSGEKPKHQLTIPEATASSATSDDIVIVESEKHTSSINSPSSPSINQRHSGNPPSGAESETEDKQPPVKVSEGVAQQHLLERVEPDYPESVRVQHLEGTVILNVHVSKQGVVRSLSCTAGDSQLCLLAAKAVRQWRFSPLFRDGTPTSFESPVTIEFALP